MCSDEQCMWIEEEVEYTANKGKNKGKVVTAKKKVAGYSMNFPQLMQSFLEHKYRGEGAETVRELLKVLAQTHEDILEFKKTAVKEDFKKARAVMK